MEERLCCIDSQSRKGILVTAWIGEESNFYLCQARSTLGWFWRGKSCGRQIERGTTRVQERYTLHRPGSKFPLYYSFADLKTTCDIVDRTMIWRILRYYGIPQKIVNIIPSFYEDNSCRVFHNTDLSAPFTVETRVRQECILSPPIFSLVIDWVLKTTMEQLRDIQWTLM